jgi:hypothetical protein
MKTLESCLPTFSSRDYLRGGLFDRPPPDELPVLLGQFGGGDGGVEGVRVAKEYIAVLLIGLRNCKHGAKNKSQENA